MIFTPPGTYGALKIWLFIRPTCQKLFDFVAETHRQTHFLNTLSTIREIFFCIYVRVKEGNTTNHTKFLPLHFVKFALLTSLVNDKTKKPQFPIYLGKPVVILKLLLICLINQYH